jgi:hypothetical protein
VDHRDHAVEFAEAFGNELRHRSLVAVDEQSGGGIGHLARCQVLRFLLRTLHGRNEMLEVGIAELDGDGERHGGSSEGNDWRD